MHLLTYVNEQTYWEETIGVIDSLRLQHRVLEALDYMQQHASRDT